MKNPVVRGPEELGLIFEFEAIWLLSHLSAAKRSFTKFAARKASSECLISTAF